MHSLIRLTLAAACLALLPFNAQAQNSGRLYGVFFADAANIRAAVLVPEGFDIDPASVKLAIAVWHADRVENMLDEKLTLKPQSDQADVDFLAGEAKSGGKMHIFTLDPADAPRLRNLQTEVEKRRTEAPGRNQAKIFLAMQLCSRAGADQAKAVLSTYLKSAPNGGFDKILDHVPLDDALPDDSTIKPCH